MRNYEVTFIVDPVQDGKDIKAIAQKYVDHLQNAGCKIVHVNEMGLRELAYPINKRSSGVYYCVEFEAANGSFIAPMELAMRRDELLLRFLTVSLDKYGVKYNQDKRDGKIGVAKKPVKKTRGGGRDRKDNRRDNRRDNRKDGQNAKAEAPKATPKPAPAPAPEAKQEEE